jgi:hypothetical protein
MKLGFILVIAVVLCAKVSASTPTVINFDNLAGGRLDAGELVTSQYSGLGVTFRDSWSAGAHAENFLSSFIAGSSPPNVLWVDQGAGAANGPTNGQYLEIDFSGPIHDVSTLFGTSVNADFTLAAYDGALFLGSTNLTGISYNTGVVSGAVSFNSTQDITSLHLFSHPLGTTTSFNFDIDNFTFDAVPEPGSMSLLGLGLTTFSAWRAIRSKSTATKGLFTPKPIRAGV